MAFVNFTNFLQPNSVLSNETKNLIRTILEKGKDVYCGKKSVIESAPANEKFTTDENAPRRVINISNNLMSHDLVCSYSDENTGIKEYHVLVGPVLGKGAFGSVVSAPLKITVTPTDVTISRVDDVAKIQKLDKNTNALDNVKNEARIQNYFLPVSSHIASYENKEGKTAITVMKKAKGISLNKIDRNNLTFDQIVKILQQIANQLAIIHSEKPNRDAYVHRDLKPENIIYDSDTGKIEIIDFGCAKEDEGSNKDRLGTPVYMSKTALISKTVLKSFDIHAFGAIAAWLLGADVFRNKEEAALLHKDLENHNLDLYYQMICGIPFDFSGMLKKIQIPADVDELLITDIIKFIQSCMSDSIAATEQPSAQTINRFFATIQLRREFNRTLNDKLITLRNAILALESQAFSWPKYNEVVKFIMDKLGSIELLPHKLPKDESVKEKSNEDSIAKLSYQDYISNVDVINEINNYLKQAQTLEPHNNVLASIIEIFNNFISDSGVNDVKKEVKENLNERTLQHINEQINQINQHYLERNLENLKRKLTDRANYSHSIVEKTNSSGIKQIAKILEKKDLSAQQKLEQIIKIAKKKVERGFSYKWSHSTFFGLGRHNGADKLYENLANLDTVKTKNYRSSVDKIEEITNKISIRGLTR